MSNYNKALADSTTVEMPNGKLAYAPSLNGNPTVLTDNYTITAADNGKTFLIATDAKVITLPATIAGFEVKIVNFGAAGNNIVTVSPVAADGISGVFTLAASVVVDAGVVNKDIINTKASATCGDYVRLFGSGVTGTKAWIVVGSAGIWAAEG